MTPPVHPANYPPRVWCLRHPESQDRSIRRWAIYCRSSLSWNTENRFCQVLHRNSQPGSHSVWYMCFQEWYSSMCYVRAMARSSSCCYAPSHDSRRRCWDTTHDNRLHGPCSRDAPARTSRGSGRHRSGCHVAAWNSVYALCRVHRPRAGWSGTSYNTVLLAHVRRGSVPAQSVSRRRPDVLRCRHPV